MPQLVLECPHCRAERIGFAARGMAAISANRTLLFMQCEGCDEGLIVVIGDNINMVHTWMSSGHFELGPIVEVYPQAEAVEAPANLPTNVLSAYLSGVDNLGRKGGANAAAIMFRRSIEITAKAVNPSAKKYDSLKKRIEDLPSEFATPAMKNWAHKIRLDANDAAHDPEEFSIEDAKQLHIFAKMFLTYAYTLPAMLEQAAQQAEDSEGN